jgi:hypothetical protein
MQETIAEERGDWLLLIHDLGTIRYLLPRQLIPPFYYMRIRNRHSKKFLIRIEILRLTMLACVKIFEMVVLD